MSSANIAPTQPLCRWWPLGCSCRPALTMAVPRTVVRALSASSKARCKAGCKAESVAFKAWLTAGLAGQFAPCARSPTDAQCEASRRQGVAACPTLQPPRRDKMKSLRTRTTGSRRGGGEEVAHTLFPTTVHVATLSPSQQSVAAFNDELWAARLLATSVVGAADLFELSASTGLPGTWRTTANMPTFGSS